MTPTVEAAIIAGCFGVATVICSVLVQLRGFNRTSSDTERTLEQQREQLKTTLTEQRAQLATTLASQREQLTTTLTEQREQLRITLAQERDRILNERFVAAGDRVGGDKPLAVRLAGVSAMAGLADAWPENRQACVNILCVYLRILYEPDPGDGVPASERQAFQASREVRRSIIGLISAHLADGAKVSWRGLNFDFSDVVFDSGSFAGAGFSHGTVDFSRAVFSGAVDFQAAVFSAGVVNFSNAEFSAGCAVDFRGARFSGADVIFLDAKFFGEVGFNDAICSGGTVSFYSAEFFAGCKVNFIGARFCVDGEVSFDSARFSGGALALNGVKFSGQACFARARFSGSNVFFRVAEFLDGCMVDFRNARFRDGYTDFLGVSFSGGIVDFSQVGDSPKPPVFSPWDGAPPPGLKLPAGGWAKP